MLGTKQIVAGVGMALLLAVGGMSQAMATTSTVSFSASSDFTGGSLNGFTFEQDSDPYRTSWRVDPQTGTPFMENYELGHVISYDKGSYDFTAISLSGLAWDDLSVMGDENTLLNVVFKDAAGNKIDSATFNLSLTNEFQTFSKSVANVHSLEFAPLGGNIAADGSWVGGSWPRVGSITMTSPVPEPETYALLLLGLVAMAGRVRLRR
ncbi:MAG: PEP-CTERM sorting domain-containing protein [Aeromonadaceae bacterium]